MAHVTLGSGGLKDPPSLKERFELTEVVEQTGGWRVMGGGGPGDRWAQGAAPEVQRAPGWERGLTDTGCVVAWCRQPL